MSRLLLIAGESPLWRLGVTTAVATTPGWQPKPVPLATDDRESGGGEYPHAAVIDLGEHPAGGLTLCRRLAAPPQHVPAVVVAGACDDTLLVCAWNAGAAAFVTTEVPPEAFASLLRSLDGSGRRYFSPEQLGAIRRWKEEVGILLQAITPREWQVLQLAEQGSSNKEIGTRMEISAHTVERHLGSIFSKLAAASRAEALALLHRHHIQFDLLPFLLDDR